MEDKECCGWPSTSRMDENVERVQALVNQDQYLTIHDLCEK
jgi:hypothetical protein